MTWDINTRFATEIKTGGRMNAVIKVEIGVERECKYCRGCGWLYLGSMTKASDRLCALFGKHIEETPDEYLRLPECLEAEVK